MVFQMLRVDRPERRGPATMSNQKEIQTEENDMANARTTTDHEKIRRWTESRGGRPTQVVGTGGMLRIDFSANNVRLSEISWDEFFEKFDRSHVEFLYDPDPSSYFNRFIDPPDDGGPLNGFHTNGDSRGDA